MTNHSKTFEFTSAVRGYHVFRQVWEPYLEEILSCYHKIGNDFDYFSIKTCTGDEVKVGHLPREISRPTKFLIDRGAVVKSKITSSHYRRSPLLQGGLEIQCIVSVTLPGTVKNHLLLERYRELVEKLYCQPKDEVIIGSFLTPLPLDPLSAPIPDVCQRKRNKQQKKKSETTTENPRKKNDIRNFFKKTIRSSQKISKNVKRNTNKQIRLYNFELTFRCT